MRLRQTAALLLSADLRTVAANVKGALQALDRADSGITLLVLDAGSFVTEPSAPLGQVIDPALSEARSLLEEAYQDLTGRWR